ncbi:MAG: hypothetical protein ACRDH5_00500 [bacterium]
MHLRADWDRLLADCPGAVAGFPPPPVGFGSIDIRREWQFEATQYLIYRGVKYLTPDASPVSGCFRLRFKFGRLTGLKQSVEDRRRPRTRTQHEVREKTEERPAARRQVRRTLAYRVGKLLGRRLR